MYDLPVDKQCGVLFVPGVVLIALYIFNDLQQLGRLSFDKFVVRVSERLLFPPTDSTGANHTRWDRRPREPV